MYVNARPEKYRGMDANILSKIVPQGMIQLWEKFISSVSKFLGVFL